MKKALVIIIVGLFTYFVARMNHSFAMAAPVEEALKIVAGIVVARIFKQDRKGTIRTIAAVAIVFTVTENISYGMVDSSNIAGRFIFTSVMHVVASVLGGFGVFGFVGGVATHFVFNAMTQISLPLYVYAFIYAVGIVSFLKYKRL